MPSTVSRPPVLSIAILLLGAGISGCAEQSDEGKAEHGTAAAPAVVMPEEPEPTPPLPHVLLISVDTLRADRLGCYGNARDTSPWIDSLAERGVRFASAHSQATQTLPSHASMLTSLYPPQFAIVRADGQNTRQHVTRLRLPERVVTLAEVLSDAGYASAAFTGGALVEARYGLGQGFEHFQAADDFYSSGLSTSMGWLEDWLDERDASGDQRPMFLFLHSFDVHDPYRSPAPFDRRFSERSAEEFQSARGYLANVPSLIRTGALVTSSDTDEIISFYDNGVAYADDRLAALEERLTARGLWDNTLVVLVSDHGEELREHGSWGHGPQPWNEVLHVPFVMRWPGETHAGTVVETPIPMIDMAPTLVDALGLARPADWRGLSLLPLVAAPGTDDRAFRRPLYAEVGDATLDVRSLRDGDQKAIINYARKTVALYDLTTDPGEQRDLSQQRSEKAQAMRSAFEQWVVQLVRESSEFEAVPMGAEEQTHLEAEAEMLKELGYIR